MDSNKEYFVPTNLAFQVLTDDYLPSSSVNRRVVDVKHQMYSYHISDTGEFASVDDPAVIQLLPPDHKTARLVDRKEAKVIPNKFDMMWMRNRRTTGAYDYAPDTELHWDHRVYTLEAQGEELYPYMLEWNPTVPDLGLITSATVPLVGAGYVGDFVLILEQDKFDRSYVRPFAVLPRPWVDFVGIQTRDIEWGKKPAIGRDDLKPGWWYSLPAGRLGLFCGYADDSKYVFLERKSGYGKQLDDNAVARGVERELAGMHNWQKVNIKSVNRSSYNKEVAKYTGDFSRILDLCEKELNVRPLPTYT